MSASAVWRRRFRLRPHTQNTSDLICLPQELRLKIIRNLMRSAEPLPSHFHLQQVMGKTDLEATEIYHERLQLSPQILSTCQTLYIDASTVLYQENTLTIFYESGHTFAASSHQRCGREDEPADILSVLKIRLPLPKYDFESLSFEPRLRHYIRQRRAVTRQNYNVANVFTEIFRSIDSFKKLSVVIGSKKACTDVPIEFAVLWLRDLLYNKHVQMTCMTRNTATAFSKTEIYSKFPKFLDFTPCQALRCCEFKIACASQHFMQLAYVRDVEGIVTGQDIAYDLFQNYWRLLLSLKSMVDVRPCLEKMETLRWEMQDCVLNYDFNRYGWLRRELLEAVKDHISANSVPEMDRLTQELNQARSREQDLVQEIAQARRVTQQRLQGIDSL